MYVSIFNMTVIIKMYLMHCACFVFINAHSTQVIVWFINVNITLYIKQKC